MVQRLATPHGPSAGQLAEEVGVSQPTLSRWLRQEQLLVQREPSKPATTRRIEERVASAPNQVWSWEIERREALLHRAVMKEHRYPARRSGLMKLRAA